MPVTVGDGAGNGYVAKVLKNNRLQTEAEVRSEEAVVSADDERAFSVSFFDAASTAGDFIGYFKNTATTRDFHLVSAEVSAVNTALWKFHDVSGTAGGASTSAPANMNLKSNKSAECEARGGAAVTGLTSDAVIGHVRSAANSAAQYDFDAAVILGTNDAIAVEYDTGTSGVAEVTLVGYYKDNA